MKYFYCKKMKKIVTKKCGNFQMHNARTIMHFLKQLYKKYIKKLIYHVDFKIFYFLLKKQIRINGIVLNCILYF